MNLYLSSQSKRIRGNPKKEKKFTKKRIFFNRALNKVNV